MVSARGGRVELVCTQVGECTAGPAAGWARCTIQVDAVHQIPGNPPVLEDATGRQLTALLPPAAAVMLPEHRRWLVEAELVGPAIVRVADDPDRLRALPDDE